MLHQYYINNHTLYNAHPVFANKFILHQHYIAKILFHYTCCGAGRGVCQSVVDNGWYRTL